MYRMDCAGNDKLRTTSGLACLMALTTEVMSRMSGANCSLVTTLMSVPFSAAFTYPSISCGNGDCSVAMATDLNPRLCHILTSSGPIWSGIADVGNQI